MTENVVSSYPYTLYLLRHGQTEWNRDGRIQGGLDSPLTSLGRKHAAQQADILARSVVGLNQMSYFCSPLPRAQETAKIALGGVQPKMDSRLQEIGCGRWEGLSPAERASCDPRLVQECKTDWDLYEKAPEGEGIPRLEERVRSFLADVSGVSVIVAHKVVLTVMRGILTGMPRSQWHTIPASQGTVIRVSNGKEETLS